MMMVQGFLLVVLLAGHSWGLVSLPAEMDNAMMDLAQADMNLRSYRHAQKQSDIKKMQELQKILPGEANKLDAHALKLNALSTKRGIRSFARMLSLRVQDSSLKIRNTFGPISSEENL